MSAGDSRPLKPDADLSMASGSARLFRSKLTFAEETSPSFVGVGDCTRGCAESVGDAILVESRDEGAEGAKPSIAGKASSKSA